MDPTTLDLSSLDVSSFSFGNLFAGFAFGVFGMFIFARGRKKSDGVLIALGLALCIYPYFIYNSYLLWGIGFVLLYLSYRRSNS